MKIPRKTLLGVSVALNVFLLALVGAHLVQPSLAGRSPEPQPSRLSRLIAALPEPDAGRFRSAMETARPDYEPAREQVSAARQAVAEAIARTPYDEPAVRSALQLWQESWRDYASRFNRAFLRAVGTLSNEGRSRLAEASMAEDARRRHAAQSR